MLNEVIRMPLILLIAAATASWVLVFLAVSSYIRIFGISGIHFILAHYLIDALVISFVYYFYYSYGAHFSPFVTMVISMTTIFILEFLFWGVLYKGDTRLLTFTHFIVPMFLVSTTIYALGLIHIGNSN